MMAVGLISHLKASRDTVREKLVARGCPLLGPVFIYGGWILGYFSNLRHNAYYDFTIAFQVNIHIGIVDDRTDLISTLEAALARLQIDEVCLSHNHPFLQRDLADA